MAQQIKPNLYDLKGVGVTISYSTSSLDGKPRLSYKKGRVDLQFTGDQIASVATGIGTLVTVTISAIPDKSTTTLSILLPDIALASGGAKQTFRTIGIITTHLTTIAGPPKGVQETYRTLLLRGTAKQVEFLAQAART